MKNRFLPVILALTLCLGSVVLPANAQTVQPEAAILASVQTHRADDIAPFSGVTLSAAGGQNIFTGANLQLYNRLKAEITDVANGARDSSIIEVDTTGMGIYYINGTLRGVDISAIIRVLTANCPYELYWFDKSEGCTSSCRGNSRDGSVTSITFQFSVSQDYAVTNPAEDIYYPYQPDPAKTRAASAVIQNAQAVVEQSRGLSDYDKLAAYRDYICGQVSYHYAAARSSGYPYGNPWQLIYVFDGDPDTNVVCEGYAKAFQYLCDQTDFSNRVECCTVSGYTPESHMWNLVRINGYSYLVDVTNSDTNNVGEYGGLFLAGVPNATGDGYTVNFPRLDLGGGRYIPASSLSYTYDDDTKALYDSSVLTLAPSDYIPDSSAPADNEAVDPSPADNEPVVKPALPAFTDVPAGLWYAEAVGWAVENAITNGTGDGLFSPAQDCTQEQILTFLYRAARGAGGMAVPASAEDMAAAVNWAREMGMIDDSFNGKALCTRSTAVSYIWQALGKEAAAAAAFTDVPAGASYAKAVDWAVANGVTNGDGSETVFSPDKVCSRGHIVTFLHRAYVPEARLKETLSIQKAVPQGGLFWCFSSLRLQNNMI